MTLADWPCIRASADGHTVLEVLVAPNAKRTQRIGLHDGALRVRLAAQPVEGQANEALLRWLASELGLARKAVTLLRGDTARRKQIHLALPLADVLTWLGDKPEPQPPDAR